MHRAARLLSRTWKLSIPGLCRPAPRRGPEAGAMAVEMADRRRREVEALMEGLPCLVWTADAAGRVSYASPQWFAYTGASPDDLVGAWIGVVHPEDREATESAWAAALATGAPYQRTHRLRRHDGEYRWHNARGMPIRDAAGAIFKWVGTCSDVHDQKTAAERVARSEAKYRGTFENAALGVGSMAPDGRWLAANAHLCGLVGYAEHELRELTFRDVTHPDDLGRDLILLGRLAAGSVDSYSLEKRYVRKDGSPVWVRVKVAAARRPGGAVDYYVATVEDIAERRMAEAEMRRAREQAERASRAKDRFLAVLSHELRTPLTPVLSAASAMLSDPDTHDEARDLAALVVKNVELESRLIDDLLDMTRIVQGKLRLHRQPVDVHAVAAQARDICLSDLNSRKVRCILALGATRHAALGDAARLQQVIWNLLKNAAKFTPEGGKITLATRNTDDGRLILEVSDTGIGMRPDEVARVFEPFEQGEEGRDRRYGGLGLGLAIVRAVVEAHGGEAEAYSPGPGEGSTFRVTLPTTSEVPRPSPREDPRPALRVVRSGRLLLVEDDVATLRTLSMLLTRVGYEVLTATNARGALEQLAVHDVDLIVSDVGLPEGLTGHDLMRQARALGYRMPAIAVTGYGMTQDVDEALAAGFTEHLTKPVDFNRMEGTIRRLLDDGGDTPEGDGGGPCGPRPRSRVRWRRRSRARA
jgi:two-component system, chemotaxis family, CheB/CheR fusion protein